MPRKTTGECLHVRGWPPGWGDKAGPTHSRGEQVNWLLTLPVGLFLAGPPPDEPERKVPIRAAFLTCGVLLVLT